MNGKGVQNMKTVLTGSGMRLAVAGVLACTHATVVAAQGATSVTNPPKTQEYGVDAGASFGLGDRSSVAFTLPAARARIGFFLPNDSRWSIEPAAFLAYTKVKDVPYLFAYNLELGALYHFAAPSRLYTATRARVAYLRPFIGFVGVATGGDDSGSDNEVSAGAGYGVKIPWRQNMAFRLEGNAGYGFDNNALRLGAFAGVSFFARR
jgi:hypothetical protein